MKIPLSSPDITEHEIVEVASVLRTPILSLGPKLVEFEQVVASYVLVDHAVAVSSGTAGLHLCVRALDLHDGDEVIVPSFTFIAVANCLMYERVKPVFVDIDGDTLNMDPAAVERAITEKTRAMIIAHTFGRPVEMEPLLTIARKHRLRVIEDACEALGAEYKGKRIGSFGDLAVFAFYPNKQITTGEGGMVVTHDRSLAERIRKLRNQGRGAASPWLQHDEIGFNYRLSELQCVLGIGQMQRVEEILRRRSKVAAAYDKYLAGVPNLIRPALKVRNGKISWFVYVVRLSREFSARQRNKIIEMLAQQGVQCGRYFAPLHQQPAYSPSNLDVSLPVTEEVADRVIALPFFNRITDTQIRYVCERLEESVSLVREA